MAIKIIFFDIDGTILDNKTKKIPNSTITSIRKLQEKGVVVVLASGRSYKLAKPIGEKLGVENFINFSGSYIKLNNEEIYKDPIPRETIEKLIRVSELNKDHLSFFGIEEIRSNELAIDVALPILEKIDCNELPKKIVNLDKEYISMCLFLDKGKVQKYEETSEEIQFYQWGIDIPNAYNIEKKGNNKANAIKIILEYLNLDKSEAMAFGDGGNDIEMLESVEIGVAMGNARESLKARANFITKSVDDDGIRHALEHFKLI